MALSNQYNFEIRWHPFLLNPSAPKEGVNKKDYYRNKFGPLSRMSEVFRGLGLEYNMSGLTGSTLDSLRLLYFAGRQGLDKQNNLAEELFLGYFTQGRDAGDRGPFGGTRGMNTDGRLVMFCDSKCCNGVCA